MKNSLSSRRIFASIAWLVLLSAAVLFPGFAQAKFPIGAYTNGQFTITFNEDKTHSVAVDGNIAVKGSYTVTDDQLTLVDKEGQYACEGTVGKYRWKAGDGGLKFEKIEDECDGRSGALSGQTWKKK